MITPNEFRQLRLKPFVPSWSVVELENWQFMGESWVGEALGFSEWLRLESNPDALGSLAIDFSTFPPDAARAVFERIGLPLHGGMTVQEVEGVLGKRLSAQRHVKGRISLSFLAGRESEYSLSCTILAEGGLVFVVITLGL